MRAVVSFFVLAFALSWYPWLLAVARGTTTGPNPLGPFVAALIVTAVVGRWKGVRALLGRIVRWRVHPLYYAVAFGLPLLIASGSILFGDKLAPVRWQDLVERFLFIFLFICLGEEPGWRGFALPELLRRYSPITATSVLAAIWTVWHLPLMGTEFRWPIVFAFAVSVFGASFVMTWMFEKTNGSVLLPMLMHASVNTIAGAVSTVWWIHAALWAVAGTAAMIYGTRGIGLRHHSPQLPT